MRDVVFTTKEFVQKEFNDLKCEMLIDMAKKIEEYLL